jgi:hypothetical protein
VPKSLFHNLLELPEAYLGPSLSQRNEGYVLAVTACVTTGGEQQVTSALAMMMALTILQHWLS